MTLADELLDRVAAAQRDELRALVHALDLARHAALVRLLEPRTTRFLTPEDAAQLVALPERRLRSLARGKPWALRVGSALRIDEAGLLAWARECSQRVGNAPNPARKEAVHVQGEQETAPSGGSRRFRTVVR